MSDPFEDFFAEPTALHYRRARLAIAEYDEYCPPVSDLLVLDELRSQAAWMELDERLNSLLPVWALSPRFHFNAALAAEARGDNGDQDLERFMLTACLDGLQATGDGSVQRPFLVTYPSDVRDLLQRLGRRSRSQRCVNVAGRHCDVVRCDGGAELWFDATLPLARTRSLATVE